MAWPMAGPSSIEDGTPPIRRRQDSQHSNKPNKTRLRRRNKRFIRQTSPSSALLTVLASVAASSVTAGCSPTPPSFLCPFLSTVQAGEYISPDNKDTADISLDLFPQSPTPTKRRRVKRHVPDRFEQGDDGRWRRMDAYTLYGSTICFNCQEPTVTTPTATSLYDSEDPSASPPAPSAAIDLNTLPSGWGTRPVRSTRTMLIVTLSLVLAFMICFLIIGCLFWRKGRAKKYREHDIEMKALRRRPDDGEDATAELVKEARSKQKVWARATARWKANARYTFRQRRGKRSTISRSVIIHNSSVSLSDISNNPPMSAVTSPAPSRSPSRRSSISAALPDCNRSVHTSEGPHLQATESQTPTSIPAVSVSPPSPVPASPPAYHQPLPRSHVSVETLGTAEALQRKRSPHLSYHSRRPSASGSLVEDDALGISSLADQSLNYTPSINAAHVATDDKALLASLGELASAPPIEPTESVGSSALEVSAPVWHDEELDDFANISHQSSLDVLNNASSDVGAYSLSSLGSKPSGFPVPPPPISLKGNLTDLSYYEYSPSYEDLADIEARIGTSAPPFDESLTPSAPPLDDESYEELNGPSAPPFTETETETEEEGEPGIGHGIDGNVDEYSVDGILEYVDEGMVPDTAFHSFGASSTNPLTPSQVQSTTASQEGLETSPPITSSPSTSAIEYVRHRSSLSLIEAAQDSVANDNVPLPRYQP